jgi:hypothetical protein
MSATPWNDAMNTQEIRCDIAGCPEMYVLHWQDPQAGRRAMAQGGWTNDICWGEHYCPRHNGDGARLKEARAEHARRFTG